MVKYILNELQNEGDPQLFKIKNMTTEMSLKPGRKYFVCFTIYRSEDFNEIVLKIDCKIQTILSFKTNLLAQFNNTILGNETFSSPFKGSIGDLIIVTFLWTAKKQVEYYQKYIDYEDGTRSERLKLDIKNKNEIDDYYKETGHPKKLLKDYKFSHTDPNLTLSMKTMASSGGETERNENALVCFIEFLPSQVFNFQK